MSDELSSLYSLLCTIKDRLEAWYSGEEVNIKGWLEDNTINIKVKTYLIFDNTDLEFFLSIAREYGLKLDFEVCAEDDYTIIRLFFYPPEE